MNTLTLAYGTATDNTWAIRGARLSALLNLWLQRARQRRQLADLSDRQLDDIGLSRTQAAHEAAKPFWQS